MNTEVWSRVAAAADGKQPIEPADLASALLELRADLQSLSASHRRCEDRVHHVDKQLGKVAAACKTSYSRVTAELIGE